MNRTTRFVLLSILMALTACSGGGGRAGGGGVSSFTIGGNVTGLGSSTSMVVQLTTAAGANGLLVFANGAYTFPGSFADGSAYTVDMTAQPTGQACTVANPAGTVSGGNVTNVDVDCVAATYTVGGSVSGLAPGKSVVLQNNSGDDIARNTNGSFSFATPVTDGGAYAATVLTQPSGQTCAVTSGSGTVSGANVTNITVACSPWTRQFGTTSSDMARAVATDASGNIFVAGDTGGDIDGAGSGTSAGGNDLFLAKYAANGNLLWLRQFGTTGTESAYGVAVDGVGNAYVVGSTTDDLDGAGSGVYGGVADAFVIKYDADGAQVWIRQLGDAGYEEARGVAVDGSDNVYVTGYTSGDIDGAGALTSAGGVDVFLAKYNASGTQQWVRQFGSGADDRSYGVAANGTNIYLTGSTYGDLDGAGPGGGGYVDIFLAAYDDNGAQQWISQIGPVAINVGTQPAVDGSGNIYVTGYTSGDLDGAGSGTHFGEYDMFVARFNSSGTLTRVTQVGTTGSEFGAGIAVDAAGNAYVAGYVWVDPGAGEYGDLRTTRIDAAGTVDWTRSLGTTYTDGGYGLAIALHGTDVYVAGQTAGDLDGNTNASVGGDDAFIVKYDTSGNKQ
jgi:Beta-propeller repeat